MGGGLMQLVAYGAQDVFLTGNPQITFFKVVYRRHTNFAVESIQQTFNGAADFGRKVTATISRNGDLITNVYLQVKLPKLADSGAKYVNSVGHALMKSIELEIGGQRIDKHYAEWLEIWSQLTLPEEKRAGYKEMVGMYDGTPEDATADRTYYIPLIFFFNRNPGLALPLIALQYHEVKINIDFEKVENLVLGDVATGDKKITDCSLWVDYVYLDTDERRRFAQVSHEMLIEQLQFTGDESISANNGTSGRTEKFRMNFNHPVKELVWVYRSQEAEDEKDHFNFSMDTVGADQASWQHTPSSADEAVTFSEPLASAKILLNGHDRMSDRPGSYFRLVQPYQHHTRVPSKHIYVYSFALKPEEHQPSGTCNFSRIDNATLSLTFNPKCDAGKVKIFAVNNNVLRIMSGMGGLAYSN